MIKLILFLIIILAVFWYYRRNRLPTQQPRRRNSSQSGTETTMVRCEQCQLYLPPANAVQRVGRWYCKQHG